MSAKHEEAPLRSFHAYRLPRGRHDLSPAFVTESQRWRLLGAAAEVLAERGYANTRTADIVSRAAVSSATFYEHYENVDTCLLATYAMAAECICGLVSSACENAPQAEWRGRLLDAVEAILAFLASEPSLAYLLGPAAPAAVPAISTARERLIKHLAKFLRSGRALRGEAAPELPPDTERRLLTGALALLPGRAHAGEAERLQDLAPQIAEILLTPYTS